MIRALYQGKTANGADVPYAKIILDAKLRIESFAFQFGFDIFPADIADYVKQMDSRLTLKNKSGTRVSGNGWMQLSESDIQFIISNATALAQRKYDFAKILSGEYGRMVWSKVMSYIRSTKDFDFDFIEETFEEIYKIETGSISKMNPSLLTPAYETTELTALHVTTGEIMQSVKFTNTAGIEQVMAVTIDSREVSVTVPANSYKIEQCNLQPTIDSDIITTGEGSFEFLVKCDDNTGISTVTEEPLN